MKNENESEYAYYYEQYLKLEEMRDQIKSIAVLRWYSILKYMFGKPMSYDEAATLVDFTETSDTCISKQRVKQIEDKALRKIKRRYNYDIVGNQLVAKNTEEVNALEKLRAANISYVERIEFLYQNKKNVVYRSVESSYKQYYDSQGNPLGARYTPKALKYGTVIATKLINLGIRAATS